MRLVNRKVGTRTYVTPEARLHPKPRDPGDLLPWESKLLKGAEVVRSKPLEQGLTERPCDPVDFVQVPVAGYRLGLDCRLAGDTDQDPILGVIYGAV